MDGLVTVVAAEQDQIEEHSLAMVRKHGIRAMDAWHLAVAAITLPDLAEPREDVGFATRDAAQATVAKTLGLALV